jgi:hypothetical protein
VIAELVVLAVLAELAGLAELGAAMSRWQKLGVATYIPQGLKPSLILRHLRHD